MSNEEKLLRVTEHLAISTYFKRVMVLFPKLSLIIPKIEPK